MFTTVLSIVLASFSEVGSQSLRILTALSGSIELLLTIFMFGLIVRFILMPLMTKGTSSEKVKKKKEETENG